MQIEISPSAVKTRSSKRSLTISKTVHFGSKGASDFTLNKDKARKGRYEKRHKRREDWTDPKTAGFYAKNTLWNKRTIQASIKDTNQRFKGLNITYKSRP